MERRLGPETKAIIDAINGLKPDKEKLNYQILTIDLAVARNAVLGNDEIALPGWFDTLTVGVLTGAATLRINERTKDAIDLVWTRSIRSPIRRLFLTNAAQAGMRLIMALGGDASFSAEPIRSGKRIFRQKVVDFNGALNAFETNEARTDTPTRFFWEDIGADIRVADLIAGIIQRIHIQITPTNAVTFQFRLYCNAVADDVGSASAIIWESPVYVIAAGATLEVMWTDRIIPFILQATGIMYYQTTYNVAPGNTPGFLTVEGEEREN